MDKAHSKIATREGKAVTIPFHSELARETLEGGSNESTSASNQQLLLTAHQVAALCGVSPRTIWRWDASGLLPTPVRVGGSTRWRRADVEDWVHARCPQQPKEK